MEHDLINYGKTRLELLVKLKQLCHNLLGSIEQCVDYMTHITEGLESSWVYFISRRLLKDVKTACSLIQCASKLLVQNHLQHQVRHLGPYCTGHAILT